MGSLRRDTERLYDKWCEEDRKLDEELDRLEKYFLEHRKCTCDENECKHLPRALVKVLGDRLYEHLRTKIAIGFRAYYDCLEDNKRL